MVIFLEAEDQIRTRHSEMCNLSGQKTARINAQLVVTAPWWRG